MLLLAVRSSGLFQRSVGWQFDLRSAIIGALVAWIIAGILYSQRERLAELARSLWAPVAAWRRRVQASQEEKYIRALRRALKPLMLLAPEEPDRVVVPPTYRAFAPLPKTIAEVGQSDWSATVSHEALLEGHNKLVITGLHGSGRTTGLRVGVWQVTHQPDTSHGRPYDRLPVWIDLRDIDQVGQEAQAMGGPALAQLASTFLPEVLPKWILRHLKSEPALILLDNWEALTEAQRATVAGWIAEADDVAQDAVWWVAASTTGYGNLVEAGFMPVELVPTTDVAAIPRLFDAWRRNLDLAEAATAVNDDLIDALAEALKAGAPLWEMHLRVVLNLMTGEQPVRQEEVMSSYLDATLNRVDLGKGSEAWATPAVDGAEEVVVTLAAMERIDGQTITNQVIRETVEAALPPKEVRHRRLESAVRRILADCGLLRQDGKGWTISHPLLADYLAARYLAAQETGQETLRAHLEDPTWLVLSEFYAGLTDAGELADLLLSASETEGDREALLRAARWGIVADGAHVWRKRLIKALAQTFMEADLAWAMRLSTAHALSLVAGEGARAFFLRMLRQPSVEVRCAAIRGLGWSGTSKEMPLLAAALRDPSPAVQASAVDALRDFGTDGAVMLLAENMPDVDETLMLRIAEALASNPSGWSPLEEATSYPDLLVRRAAAHGLGLIAEAWAEERLLEIGREDAEWLVRSAAESALQAKEERAETRTQVPPPPRVDQMDWLIAWAARQGQGLGIGEAARETLLRAAQEGNVDAKVLSALTLAQIGRRTDLPLLEVLGREQDPEVQRAASWALQQVQQRYRSRPSA